LAFGFAFARELFVLPVPVRDKRKAEVHADVQERVGKLKEKLHVS
jgi:hypothetical protein